MTRLAFLSRRALGVLVVAGVAMLGPTGTASAAPGPAQDNFLAAFGFAVLNPTADPPGANDFGCRPGAAHPNPVVLVHGTFENKYDNWAELAPRLAGLGFCVFALNYGGDQGAVLQGLNDIAASAGQLRTFVGQVLAATGARKVDLVGHSQGGMMPRYFIKNLGGAAMVNSLVGLAPSNHGTTLSGLATAFAGVLPEDFFLCAACVQQIQGSHFITALNAGGETDPAVRYTVIATRNDEVVTPFQSAFLAPGPNVTNLTLQDLCPNDSTEHVGLSYDRAALQLAVNALDPAHATRPAC